MGGTANFYADDALLDDLDKLPNKSEFIRAHLKRALANSDESERRLNEIDDEVDDIDQKIRDLKREKSELLREREELEAIVGIDGDEDAPGRVNHVVNVVEAMLEKPTDVWSRHLNSNLNDDLAESIQNDVAMHRIDNPDANAVSGEMVLDDLRDEGFDPDEAVTAEHNDVYALTDEAFEIFDGVTERERSEIEELLN